VRLHGCTPELVDLEADGIRRRYAIRTGADGAVHVQSDLGAVTLRALPRFPAPGEEEAPPGSLTAPMHGTVVRVLAGAGEPVRQGQVLLVLEAMKMEQEIVAPASGVLVELLVRERAHVERGALLAVVRSAQD
jgi:propionyl-CoA carboxylase alpha chain